MHLNYRRLSKYVGTLACTHVLHACFGKEKLGEGKCLLATPNFETPTV